MAKPIKIAVLGKAMLAFAAGVGEFRSPQQVLDELHKVSSQTCDLNVLGAAIFPLWGDWSGVEKGKTLFLHESAPKGWWDEWLELSRKYPGPAVTFARLSIAPFTLSDLMRSVEPLGIERWSIELGLKYGIRDGFTCPVGGRWVVVFWSRHVLSTHFPEEARVILYMGANFATIQLQKLIGPQVGRIGHRPMLTPRELAVLRLLAEGNRIAEVAAHMQLGEETIRSHVKKAQAKIGARNTLHAVTQAMRRQLIV